MFMAEYKEQTCMGHLVLFAKTIAVKVLLCIVKNYGSDKIQVYKWFYCFETACTSAKINQDHGDLSREESTKPFTR